MTCDCVAPCPLPLPCAASIGLPLACTAVARLPLPCSAGCACTTACCSFWALPLACPPPPPCPLPWEYAAPGRAHNTSDAPIIVRNRNALISSLLLEFGHTLAQST